MIQSPVVGMFGYLISSRFRNTECSGFVNLRPVGRRCKFVKYCTLHNQDMHLLDPFLNVRTGGLSVDQEEQFSELIWTFRNAREICRCARTKFHNYSTKLEVCNLRTRLRSLVIVNDVVSVKQIAGCLSILLY